MERGIREGTTSTALPLPNRGFTLLELAVYLAVSSLIILSAIQVLSSTQDSQERGTQVADSRQNARACMAMMARELRAAGSGIGFVPVTASYNDEPLTLYGIDEYDSAPGFTITGAMEDVNTTLRRRMKKYTSPMRCKKVTDFAVGDLVIVTDNVTAHMFQVTEIDYELRKLKHAATSPYNPNQAYDDWPPNGYAKGSHVRKVTIVSYYVDESEHALVRSEFGEEPTYVAAGIDSLLVTYVLSDGSVTQSPDDPSQIRAIALTIKSRSNAMRPGGSNHQILETTVVPRCSVR